MLLLPPMFYGRSERYKDFSFTVSLQFEALTALIRDVLDSDSIVPRTALLAGLIEAISIHRDKLSAFVKTIPGN